MHASKQYRTSPGRRRRWTSAAATVVLGGALALGVVAPATASAAVSGPVVAWGNGGQGRVGVPNATALATPTPVPGTDGSAQVAGGGSHSVIRRGGVPLGTGSNADRRIGRLNAATFDTYDVMLGDMSAITDVAAGLDHTLVLEAGGTVRAFGKNTLGQLGFGNTSAVTTPPTTIPGLSNVIQLAAGREHSVALLADGTVRAWGANTANQVGDGTGGTVTSPTVVPGVSDVKEVAAGEHTLALRNDGRVYAWGLNADGQLGLGDTTARAAPELIPGIDDAVAVAAGRQHSLVLLADGSVRAFGLNTAGRLGDGTLDRRTSPVRVLGLPPVVEVSTALAGSTAREADGTVWVWGNGGSGMLADGDVSNHVSAVPLRVPGVRAQRLGRGSSTVFHQVIAHVPVAADGPLSFMTQARETLSAPKTVTLTVGTGQITRLRTVGANSDDFLVTGDSCVGEALGAGDTCTVRVRFSPSAAGERSAQLRISSTTAADVMVDLGGEGGELVAGPEGPSGPEGPRGDAGTPGADGIDGLPGPIGLVGPVGPVGPKGESGVSRVTAPSRATVACRRISSGKRIRCTVRATAEGRLRVTGRVSGVRRGAAGSGRSRVTLTLVAPRRNARPQVAVTVRTVDGRRATLKVRVGATKTSSLRSA